MVAGLGIILLAVLALPFVSKKIEANLELFLFVMGLCATLITGTWFVSHQFNTSLLLKVLRSPVLISGAVFVSGLLFKALQGHIRSAVGMILRVIPARLFLFFVVLLLGLASSVITAIIAALVLVEVINILGFERRQEIALDVIGCFAIGLGATLTPVGEPLSTIAISKLGQDFWYLVRLLGVYVIPGIVAFALFASFYIKPELSNNTLSGGRTEETYADVAIRAVKVYLFVMALEMLGEGFRPVIDTYLLGLSHELLFWLNMTSAILDNATLTAAEISIRMTGIQIKSILLGLTISGGMLIPGNIPNIISAGRLNIRSGEWARLGLPVGLANMLVYFVVLLV